MKKMEKPFFTFIGEKCCNTTILDPQQFKSVGVGQTFHSLSHFHIFCWTYSFFSDEQMKTVGVAPFLVALLLFLQILALKSVGGTFSLLLDQQFQSLTFLYFFGPTVSSPQDYCRDFFPFVGPTISGPEDCRTYKSEESNSNKRVKSLHNSSKRPTVFTVGEPKSVGPTKFPQQKRESNSNTNSS